MNSNDRLGNRRIRTRKDLLQAASRLLKTGGQITMDEVAREALVSRATAYRYFDDIDQLLLEVAIDDSMPDSKEIFSGMSSPEIVDRADHAEAVMHDFVYKNEKQLRMILSRNIAKRAQDGSSAGAPARQNRRSEYIHEALLPHRDRFDAASYKKLTESLALVFGPEAMIVYRDVVPLDAKRAREVKRWMIATLVTAALRESRTRGKKAKRTPGPGSRS